MKSVSKKLKNYIFLVLINIIGIAIVAIAFEKFFLIEYYNKFLKPSGKIELKVDRDKSNYAFQDCKDPLSYSFVDTMGAGLLRDQDFGFFLDPGLAGVNTQGFLFDCFEGSNRSDEYKVVLIGDSFTASTQVPISKTWPSLLRETITSRLPSKNIKIYNLATGGAGMLHQLQQIKFAKKMIKPDLIIQSMFLGNDLTDEDYESFQLTQPPHQNFPPYAFQELKDSKISLVSPNLKYYAIMNLANALDSNGRQLQTEFGKLDLNLEWLWNDSKDLPDRYNLNINFNGKLIEKATIEYTPIKMHNSEEVALKIDAFHAGELITLEILRSVNYVANRKKIIFARVCIEAIKKCSDVANFTDATKNENIHHSFEKFEKSNSPEGGLFIDKSGEPSPIPLEITYNVARLLLNRIKNSKTPQLTVEPLFADRIQGLPRPYMIFVEEVTPYIEQRKQLFMQNISEIFKQTEGENYLLLTIPSMLEASEEYWRLANISNYSDHSVSRLHPEKIMDDIFSGSDKKPESFMRYIKNSHTNNSELYDPVHRHFTELGHQKFHDFVIEKLNFIKDFHLQN